MSDKIRITQDDLYSKAVETIVAEQEALARAMPASRPTPRWRRILFSSLFFLAAAGLLGGLIGWMIIEPFIKESITVYGLIEDIQLPTLGEAEGRELHVRGLRVFVDDRVTRVNGENEYATVKSVNDLKTGQPVRIEAMTMDPRQRIFIGTRVRVQPIPPGRDTEPLPDMDDLATSKLVSSIFAFAIVGTCIAGLIAAADGFMSRNLRRGLLAGACGTGLAAAGGLLGLIPGGLVFALFTNLATQAAGEGMWTSDTVTGMPLLLIVVGRSLTWGILGLTVGLGQGVAMRSKKLVVNGLLGGMLGGLLGGLFFEPIIKLFANTDLSGQALVSRAFGFSIIGLSAGFMIGLVEHLSKDAWLLMRAGPLAGKQFIIYKNPTTLGSSPKCEVYLFKDPDVEPRHALVRKVGTRHEIEDLDTPAGTLINGRRVRRQMLGDGDQIMIGKTILEYAERSKSET